MSVESSTILITGATSGIGEAAARYLVKKGATVLLVGRSENKLKDLKNELGDTVYTFVYDFADLDNIKKIFEFSKEKGLKFDGMVHAAGIVEPAPIKACSIESIRYSMDINAFSFFELGKIFSNKKYSNDNSSVVAISSLAAKECGRGQVAYAASKASLNTIVEVMSKEFLKRKIRVNAIMPAMVDTPMGRKWVGYVKGDESAEVDWQPFGAIDPEYIAYLVEFLLSEKAKFMTGACIPVNAGAFL